VLAGRRTELRAQLQSNDGHDGAGDPANAAAPANTAPGRYRVPSTKLASPELSGNSAAKIVPKTIAAISRPDT
jgi:hypothetical protein